MLLLLFLSKSWQFLLIKAKCRMYECIASWAAQCGYLSVNVIITMETEAASSEVILFPSLKLSSLTILVPFHFFAISCYVNFL